ncbi:uncharacterized protein LOC120905512 [Anopheles arabiensis]|uniref:uncharacterized protein LOC120905512 n=1 Tax=Anopheles arabiensis TaxID=7173 RepID=UPI001AACC215|nr:uncharacterized protein LOC120905512 [Anopheles arabiensis]
MWWRRRVQLLIAALWFHCCCWARPPLPTQPLVNLADIVGVVLHTHFRTPFATTLVTVRSATQRGAWLQQDLLERLLVRHGQGQLVVQLEGVPSPAQLLHRHPPWSRTLLLAESYDALRTVFGQLTPDRFDFTGRYLIALSEAPATLATVDRIFHELWLRQIVNVVVALRPLDDDHSSAAASAGPVQLWTYFPFSPGLCRIPKPHLLFTWPNDTLLYGVDFYPRKSDQFHGCPLRVGSFETRPFTILAGGDGAHPPAVGGFEGDLLHSLSARLNFREDVRVPPRAQQWGEAAFENSTGLMRMLYTEEVDFGLSCLGVSVERSAMLKAGKVHFTTDLVVVVPPGKPYTAFEKLFQPFQPPVWLAVGFCTGVGFGVLATLRLLPLDGRRRATVRRYVAGDARLQAPALNLVRVLLSSPLPFTPTGTFPRTLLAQWMLVSLLLSLLYQGSLFQYLQRASTHPPMRTLAEIDRSGALYHIASSARRFFLPYPQRLQRLRYFPPVPDSIAAWLRWMGSHPGEPHVAMCTRDHVAYHNAQHGRTDGRQLLIARESMALYAITILYPKRSMLTASFDQHIERIGSSGLLKYWSARYGDYHFEESRASSTTDQRATATAGPRPVSVEQLAGALQLLLGMLLAATLLFLAELGWARHTRPAAANLANNKTLAKLTGQLQSASFTHTELLIRATADILLQHYTTFTSKQLYVRWEDGASGPLVDEILRRTATHLSVLVERDPPVTPADGLDQSHHHQQLRLLNLLLVADCAEFDHVVAGLTDELYDYSGLYTVLLVGASSKRQHLETAGIILRTLWARPFPPKLDNFYHCPLAVATFPVYPFIIPSAMMADLWPGHAERTEQEEEEDLKGIEAMVLRTLRQRLNFRLQLMNVDPPDWGTAGPRDQATGASAYVSSCATLLLRCPLAKPIWTFLLCSLAAGLAVIGWLRWAGSPTVRHFVLGHDAPNRAWPAMIAVLLGAGLSRAPRGSFARALLLCWLAGTLVLRSAYTGSMIRFLQSDRNHTVPANLPALLDAGYQLYMYRNYSFVFDAYPHIGRRVQLVTAHQFRTAIVRRLQRPGARLCVLLPLETVTFLNRNLTRTGQLLRVARERVTVAKLAIYTQRTSALLGPLNKLLERFVASGLLHRWAAQYHQLRFLANPYQYRGRQQLVLADMDGPFEILLVGLGLGAGTFLIELVAGRWEGGKRKKRQSGEQ